MAVQRLSQHHYCHFQAIRLREQRVLKMMCVGTKSWNCLLSYLMGLFILNVPGRPVSWPVLWTLPNELRKFWYIGGFESKYNSFILLLGFVGGGWRIELWVCVCFCFSFNSIFFTFMPVTQWPKMSSMSHAGIDWNVTVCMTFYLGFSVNSQWITITFLFKFFVGVYYNESIFRQVISFLYH